MYKPTEAEVEDALAIAIGAALQCQRPQISKDIETSVGVVAVFARAGGYYTTAETVDNLLDTYWRDCHDAHLRFLAGLKALTVSP